MKYILTAVVFSAGLVLGTIGSHLPINSASASTGSSMAMSRGMMAKSPADRQMMQVMSQMQSAMQNLPLDGKTDRDFILMMIPHHQSAVGMAEVEIHHGTNAKVKTLARSIVKSQSAEISQMKSWLRSMYGVR